MLFRELGIVNCYTLEASFYGGECLGKTVYEETESSSEELEQQNEDQDPEEAEYEEPDDEDEEEEDEDEDEPDNIKEENADSGENEDANSANEERKDDEDQAYFEENKEDLEETPKTTEDVVTDDKKITITFDENSTKIVMRKETSNDDSNKDNYYSENEVSRKWSPNVSTGNKNRIKLPSIEPYSAQKQEEAETNIERTVKKVKKIVGDIHLNSKHLRQIGQDFCKTLFLFFNESVMMRKLYNLRKFHRPKIPIRKKTEKKVEHKGKTNQTSDSIKPIKPKALNSGNKPLQKGKKIVVNSDASYRGDEKQANIPDTNIIRMNSNRTSNELSILIK